MSEEEVAAELRRRGCNAEDIGTHRIRKGASTYCTSESTAAPPSVAVHLRVGWAIGGVQDRYLRYDAAGDMYVVPTVSGLPIGSSRFATLPPYFRGHAFLVVRSLHVMWVSMHWLRLSTTTRTCERCCLMSINCSRRRC